LCLRITRCAAFARTDTTSNFKLEPRKAFHACAWITRESNEAYVLSYSLKVRKTRFAPCVEAFKSIAKRAENLNLALQISQRIIQFDEV
jgi:hypothetical protein